MNNKLHPKHRAEDAVFKSQEAKNKSQIPNPNDGIWNL